jgi:hypothetical protein
MTIWGPARNVSPLDIEAGKQSLVRVRVRRLSHGRPEYTPRFRVQFPSNLPATSFHAEYVIHADELLEEARPEPW